ncbi:MAG: SocA family protein, partial [Oscillospiraceae bacterium]|nr:SocA family protein [Oscillospiraceae bacterium]
YNVSMSGLVYQHMPMGALPIVHSDLMDLVPVETIVDDYSQYESYRVLPSPDFSEDVFSAEEKDVLNAVVRKFRNYTGKEIANYMHEEVAYTRTKDREIIPYSLAKMIRPF